LLELGDYDGDHLGHGLGKRQPRAVSFTEMKIDFVALGQTEP
jgi:hypothetical protein